MTPVSLLRRGWRKYLAACGLLFAFACTPVTAPAIAAAGVQLPAGNAARIWFYRDGWPSDGLGVTLVRLNGAPVGQSEIDSRFYRDVPAGPYRITVDNPVSDIGQSLDVNLAPGQVAYVKVMTLDNWDVSTGRKGSGGAHTTYYLSLVPPAIGSVEADQLPYYGR